MNLLDPEDAAAPKERRRKARGDPHQSPGIFGDALGSSLNDPEAEAGTSRSWDIISSLCVTKL